MASPADPFDYHGALVVVETDAGEIVLIHPPGGPAEAPASLPSNPCRPGEEPADGAVRVVRELTGLEVSIDREFVTFIQHGTPFGTMCAHGYVAHVTGGALLDDGPEGAARAYPVDSLPAIMPIRVANQRTLDAYLAALGGAGGELAAGGGDVAPAREAHRRGQARPVEHRLERVDRGARRAVERARRVVRDEVHLEHAPVEQRRRAPARAATRSLTPASITYSMKTRRRRSAK